ELRSVPLHNSMFLSLLSRFALCGAAHANTGMLSVSAKQRPSIASLKQPNADLAFFSHGFFSIAEIGCVGIAGVKSMINSAATADVEIGLLASFYSVGVARGSAMLIRPGGCCAIFFQNFFLSLFDKGRKLHSPVIRDLNARRRPTNTHGGNRSVDLHVAALCNLAGDKSKRSLGQAKQSRIRFAVWIVYELGHHHVGIAGQIERRAIGESNADFAIGSSCNHVAEIDQVPKLGLTGLIAERGLNDHRAGMSNRD